MFTICMPKRHPQIAAQPSATMLVPQGSPGGLHLAAAYAAEPAVGPCASGVLPPAAGALLAAIVAAGAAAATAPPSAACCLNSTRKQFLHHFNLILA